MGQIHAKTDKLSLVAVPEKGDKMRLTSLSWDDAVVVLPYRAMADSYSSATKDLSDFDEQNFEAVALGEPDRKIAGPGGAEPRLPRPWERVSASCKRVLSGSDDSSLRPSGVRDEHLYGPLNRASVLAQAGFEIPEPL